MRFSHCWAGVNAPAGFRAGGAAGAMGPGKKLTALAGAELRDTASVGAAAVLPVRIALGC